MGSTDLPRDDNTLFCAYFSLKAPMYIHTKYCMLLGSLVRKPSVFFQSLPLPDPLTLAIPRYFHKPTLWTTLLTTCIQFREGTQSCCGLECRSYLWPLNFLTRNTIKNIGVSRMKNGWEICFCCCILLIWLKWNSEGSYLLCASKDT